MSTLTRRSLMGAMLASPFGEVTEKEGVPVVLALGVDVSGSVTPLRYRLQMRGYHDALLSEEVIAALPRGGVALSLYHWALFQRQQVAWTLVRNRSDMAKFCAPFLTLRRDPSVNTATSISGALWFGMEVIERAPYVGERAIIDISGDGDESGEALRETKDAAVQSVRDRVVAAGIVINALPILADVPDAPQPTEGLDVYYRDNVIGGAGAFVLPADGYMDFQRALKIKLVRELIS